MKAPQQCAGMYRRPRRYADGHAARLNNPVVNGDRLGFHMKKSVLAVHACHTKTKGVLHESSAARGRKEPDTVASV